MIFKYSLAAVLILATVNSWLLPASASQSKYVPVAKYDPKRDAAIDIQDAVKEAQLTHKRILLEVGGLWCGWCHTLDNFFDANPELLRLRDQNFVTVKINFSEENENKEVLSRYGRVESFPHLFVLESDGNLLLSKDTAALESGRSYNLGRLTAFLQEWALQNRSDESPGFRLVTLGFSFSFSVLNFRETFVGAGHGHVIHQLLVFEDRLFF